MQYKCFRQLLPGLRKPRSHSQLLKVAFTFLKFLKFWLIHFGLILYTRGLKEVFLCNTYIVLVEKLENEHKEEKFHLPYDLPVLGYIDIFSLSFSQKMELML